VAFIINDSYRFLVGRLVLRVGTDGTLSYESYITYKFPAVT